MGLRGFTLTEALFPGFMGQRASTWMSGLSTRPVSAAQIYVSGFSVLADQCIAESWKILHHGWRRGLRNMWLIVYHAQVMCCLSGGCTLQWSHYIPLELMELFVTREFEEHSTNQLILWIPNYFPLTYFFNWLKREVEVEESFVT